MKTPPSDSDPHWEKLLRQARMDIAPPVDMPALLHAVRTASLAHPEDWASEFSALFSSGRFIPGCLAGAAAFALIATWQAWDSWQTMPWVQLLDVTIGGAS
jgi:hypothetical protein